MLPEEEVLILIRCRICVLRHAANQCLYKLCPASISGPRLTEKRSVHLPKIGPSLLFQSSKLFAEFRVAKAPSGSDGMRYRLRAAGLDCTGRQPNHGSNNNEQHRN